MTSLPATLDRDVTCLNCGYNLRGVSPAGDCPECGMRIAVALREDYLADAPKDWLRRLRGGATLLVVGTLVSLPLLNLGPIIAGLGYWRIAAAQPGRDEPRHDMLVRIFSRGTLVPGGVGLAVILNVILFFLWRYRFGNTFDWRAYDTLFIALGGYFGIGVAAMAQYLRTLAERAGDTRLAARTGRLFWVWIVGGLVIVALGGLTNLYSWIGRPWHQHQMIFAAVAAVTVLLLAAWLWAETLRVVMAFRRTMRQFD